MKLLLIICFAFISMAGFTQQIKATYAVKVNQKYDFNKNATMPKAVADRIKKRMSEPQIFYLHLNREESIYKKEEKLEASNQWTGKSNFRGFGTSNSKITHTNLASKKQTVQQEMFGKVFLIIRNLKQPQWTFTGASKQIGNYTAYQATYTEMQVPPSSQISFGGDKDGEAQKKPDKIPVTVSVWFTPDIPIAAGPEKYVGLPGLILMVQDGNKTLLCTSVQMNVTEKIPLDPPTKGKKVTGKEFYKIREEKIQQMRSRYNNNRSGDSNNRLRIR